MFNRKNYYSQRMTLLILRTCVQSVSGSTRNVYTWRVRIGRFLFLTLTTKRCAPGLRLNPIYIGNITNPN